MPTRFLYPKSLHTDDLLEAYAAVQDTLGPDDEVVYVFDAINRDDYPLPDYLRAEDARLHTCDFCGATEVDDVVDNPTAQLRTFHYGSDGTWMCNMCQEELTHG